MLCHSDFFNQYAGMDKEYTLPPDNCAYFGIPRNSERERQPWTNYDLRALVKGLKDEGIEFYASVFGITMKNSFHEEWGLSHREVLMHGNRGEDAASGVFCLKRMKDGSYYEDYFIDMAERVLVDYGMAGLHLSDAFCPWRGGMLHNIDFSTDYVGQFLDDTGITLPDEIMETMGNDDKESETVRSRWIYRNLREEWVLFNKRRWIRFFTKLTTRLHAVGKKVSVLGMYCTDPFETLYCIGIDLKSIVEAGVDTVTANILPTSVFFTTEDREYYFNKYMAIAPTTAAHLPKGKLISMVGVHDPTEEWSMIHHQPTQHERDLYTMTAYFTADGDGVRRSLDGYMLCLGDGLSRADWQFLHERMSGATDARLLGGEGVAMLWSESANEAMLREFIKTRRWTPHKFFYTLANLGEHLSGTVTPEALSYYKGAIFAPNIDMLPPNELKALREYRGGAVIYTASVDYSPTKHGIDPVIEFEDSTERFRLKAGAFGCEANSELRERIEELLRTEDNTPELEGDLLDVEEPNNTLVDTLVFNKVSLGFTKALAGAVGELKGSAFEINMPAIVTKVEGGYRLYLFNDSYLSYKRAFVKCRERITETRTVSKFPILPPRFVDEATGTLHHAYVDNRISSSFEIKIQPGGVTVIEVYTN